MSSVHTLHACLLLALARVVSGGGPDLVHLHARLAAVLLLLLLTSLAETTADKLRKNIYNSEYFIVFRQPAAAFIILIIVGHLTRYYFHPRVELKVNINCELLLII